MATHYALSVKQPWASLLVHGLKQIEVRSWPTARRGRILIHAASVSDDRQEAWALVPPELRASAEQRGGVIGLGELIDCIAYRSPEAFAADRGRHLNDPSWFTPPVLHGFSFNDLRPVPFHPCSGWMRFFKIECAEVAIPLTGLSNPEGAACPRPRLLVSVRSAVEAEAALAGGADLIDVKEPERGSLGAADLCVVAQVIAAVAGRRPVSAALGELLESFWKPPPVLPPLGYVKWGLAGFQRNAPLFWRWQLAYAAQRLVETNPGCRPVAVAYADRERAHAPPSEEVLDLAVERGMGAFLLDTWHKDGSTLLDWLELGAVERMVDRCRAANVPIALAGSLGPAEIERLRPLRPDWFAVRGAVCPQRQRGAAIDERKVRDLVELLRA